MRKYFYLGFVTGVLSLLILQYVGPIVNLKTDPDGFAEELILSSFKTSEVDLRFSTTEEVNENQIRGMSVEELAYLLAQADTMKMQQYMAVFDSGLDVTVTIVQESLHGASWREYSIDIPGR